MILTIRKYCWQDIKLSAIRALYNPSKQDRTQVVQLIKEWNINIARMFLWNNLSYFPDKKIILSTIKLADIVTVSIRSTMKKALPTRPTVPVIRKPNTLASDIKSWNISSNLWQLIKDELFVAIFNFCNYQKTDY